MAKDHPDVRFERFADDAVCQCSSEYQARRLQGELERRFAECGLALHSDKTRIVYCKDNARRGQYPNQKFDFLGYTFRPRLAMNRWGKTFVNFSPGTSNRAARAIRQTMRGWKLDCHIDKRIDDLANGSVRRSGCGAMPKVPEYSLRVRLLSHNRRTPRACKTSKMARSEGIGLSRHPIIAVGA
jgi:Reverse transcriptase (RNA-dependent DNA polymerase)